MAINSFQYAKRANILVVKSITSLCLPIHTIILMFLHSARHLTVLLWPYGVVFPIVGVIVLFYSTMFLLKAGCIDPGFIPRATAAEGAYYRSLADSDSECI